MSNQFGVLIDQKTQEAAMGENPDQSKIGPDIMPSKSKKKVVLMVMSRKAKTAQNSVRVLNGSKDS